MKKVVVIFFIVFGFFKTFSQDVEIGIRQNQYFKVELFLKKGIHVNFENSLFLANLNEQFLRGEIGYTHRFNNWSLNASGFIGSSYKGDFQNLGMRLGSLIEKEYFSFNIAFQPFYDTGYGYTSCYGINVGILLKENIRIEGVVANIPENRIPEKRFRLGVLFEVEELWVKPEISLPQTGDLNTSRILISFGYDFEKK